MASQLSDTILLNVATSLDTRLVLVPLRTETIEGIRATIKDYHKSLFPQFGDVDVSSIEMQVFGAKSRLADPLMVGKVFFNESQANLFARVRVRMDDSMPRERQILARPAVSEGPALALSPRKRRQAGGLIPAQGRRQDFIPTLNKFAALSKRRAMEPLSDDGNGSDTQRKPRRNPELRKEKSGDNETESPAKVMSIDAAVQPPATGKIDTQSLQTSAVGIGLDDPVEPIKVKASAQGSAKDPAASNALIVDQSQKSQEEAKKSDLRSDSGSSSESDISDDAQSDPREDPKKSPGHEGAPSKAFEKDSVTNHNQTTPPAVSSRKEEEVKGSGDVGIVSNEALSQKPGLVSGLDSVVRNLLGFEPGQQEANVSSKTHSKLGDTILKKANLKANKVPVAPTLKENSLKTSVPGISTPQSKSKVSFVSDKAASPAQSKQNGIANEGRANSAAATSNGLSPRIVAQKSATSVILANQSGKSISRKVSSSTSTTYSDSEGQSEDSKKHAVMKREEPRKDVMAGVKVKLEVSSSSESDSSELSDSESRSQSDGQESSSEETDESEDLHPIASQTGNRGAALDGVDLKSSRSGRRSMGGPLDSKYQHLLDSQDGFDELINLSQQKVLTSHDADAEGLGQRAEVENGGAEKPSDLAVGTENVIRINQSGQTDKSEADGKGGSVQEASPPMVSDLDDKLTPPQSVQGDHVAETRESQSRAPRSEGAAEVETQDPAAHERNLPKKNSKATPESPLKGSEDLLHMKAAEQLARMSAPNIAGEDSETGHNVKRKRLKKGKRIVEDDSQTQESDAVVDIAGDGESSPKHVVMSQKSSDAQTSEERGGNAASFEYRDLRSRHLAAAYTSNVHKHEVAKKAVSPTISTQEAQVVAVSSLEAPVTGKDMQNSRDSERVAVQQASKPDNTQDMQVGDKNRPSSRGKERKRKGTGKVTEDNAVKSVTHLLKEPDQNGAASETLTSPKAAGVPNADVSLTQLPDSQTMKHVSLREVAAEKKKKKRKSVADEAEEGVDQGTSPSNKNGPDENRNPGERASDVGGHEEGLITENMHQATLAEVDGDSTVKNSQDGTHIQANANGESVPDHSKQRRRLKRKNGQGVKESSLEHVPAEIPLSPSPKSSQKSKSTKHVDGDDSSHPVFSVDDRNLLHPAELVQDEKTVTALGDEENTPQPRSKMEVVQSDADDEAKAKKKQRKSRKSGKELPNAEDHGNGKDIELDAGVSKSCLSNVRKNSKDGDMPSSNRKDEAQMQGQDDNPAEVVNRKRSEKDVINFSDEDHVTMKKRKNKAGAADGGSVREISSSEKKQSTEARVQFDSSAKQMKSRRRSEEKKHDLSVGERTAANKRHQKPGVENSESARPDLDSDDDRQDTPSPDKKQSIRKRAQSGAKSTKTNAAVKLACPNGCGKNFTAKNSTYFRHRKQCELAPP